MDKVSKVTKWSAQVRRNSELRRPKLAKHTDINPPVIQPPAHIIQAASIPYKFSIKSVLKTPD
jgi:hypothetical protein